MRLEYAAEPLGQPGHFHCIANGLIPIVQLLISRLKLDDFLFLSVELGGFFRMVAARVADRLALVCFLAHWVDNP